MTGLSPAGEDVLLAVGAYPGSDHASLYAAVDRCDWPTLVERALELRMAPLLLHDLDRSGALPVVPDEQQTILGDARRYQTFLALAQAKGAVRVAKLLNAEGMHSVFLKGLALAHGCYPAAALRPLRDVDVLLTPSEAHEAQALLLASGEFNLLETERSIDPRHHLFPMVHRETGLLVEVHHALSGESDWPGEPALVDRLLSDNRPLHLLGEEIRVPSPGANLMHLIAHAGRNNSLDNGPLALADLHYLLQRYPIPAADIVCDAGALGLSHSLAVLAALARQSGANWTSGELIDLGRSAEPFLPAARIAALPLSETLEQNKQRRRIERARKRRGWVGLLLMALTPDPKAMAGTAGLPADSRWRWMGYPAWLVTRICRFLSWRGAEMGSAPGKSPSDLSRWLSER